VNHQAEIIPFVKEDEPMSTEASAAARPLTPFEQLRLARDIIGQEAEALADLSRRLDRRFCQAVDLVYHARGSVLATGMGKAGLIAQKIAATLASTGTRSHFLHPGEAFHGDLGRIHRDDVVLAFSQSGETEEVVRLLPSLADFGVAIVAVTGAPESSLGRAARVVVDFGSLREACPLGLAPSTSTAVMLAIGDALALVASRMRNFEPADFARFHPGGSLGLRLSKVDDHMRPLSICRVARENQTVREVFIACTRPGRRAGAILLVGETGALTGVFTDSDLARLFESTSPAALDRPIVEVMTQNPITISAGAVMRDAIDIMAERKISELPVLDQDGKPVGMIDLTDVVGLVPKDAEFSRPAPPDVAAGGEEPNVLIYPNSPPLRRRSS
jgi:arabinose-5-phosphate isomerase